ESLAGRILRVGVFVNPEPDLPLELLEKGWIDAIQLHGDETPEQAAPYRDAKAPFIKAIGVAGSEHLKQALDYGAQALLMDAHAPGVYGGTGETFDWNTAIRFKQEHPDLPIILAGGIVPENALEAAQAVFPAALDVASGAEISPGRKDFDKVQELLTTTRGC
ncbi:MAG: phosphoribosylanthranilate isomerase, partial [Akkermansiaceae bacterium]|nr:phosphoribosylanthranilate isomerase [Akkermansiaceae bacterium]